MVERTMTLRALAKALGVTPTSVLYHVDRGLPCSQTGAHGGKAFNEQECREWIAANTDPSRGGGRSKLNAIAQEKAGASFGEDGDTGSALEVDLKLKAARTREIELRLAVKEGKLVDAADVERRITAHLATARMAFEAVSGKAAAKIVGILAVDHSRQGEIADAIAEEINDAILVLSTQ